MDEMDEQQHRFTREAIDRQTERWTDEHSPAEQRLIQQLHALAGPYARQNERSLDRVWQRLLLSRERAGWPQEALPAAAESVHVMESEHPMFDQETRREAGAVTATPYAAQRPRHWLGRTLRSGAIAAVLLLGLLSWALISSALHGSSRTGQPSPKTISSATLLCSSAPYSQDGPVNYPSLAWSAQGAIAAMDPYLQIFSARTCAAESLIPSTTTLGLPVWSPDGKRLLLLHGDTANVRDAATGQLLASFHADPGAQFDQGAWTPDGQQIVTSEAVAYLSYTNSEGSRAWGTNERVQLWNASTGALLRTAFTFDNVVLSSLSLSPNGQYLALQLAPTANPPEPVVANIQFWNIRTGAKMSTTAASVTGMLSVWSPSGDAFAVVPAQANAASSSIVQVWSTATGQLTASISDDDTFEGMVEGLAWSPDGRYLAESGAAIHIWDVASHTLVATFGKVTPRTTSSDGTAIFTYIASVAWSPDGSMLASTTLNGNPMNQQHTLNVWQLH